MVKPMLSYLVAISAKRPSPFVWEEPDVREDSLVLTAINHYYAYSYALQRAKQNCYDNASYGKRYDTITNGVDSFLTVAVDRDEAKQNALNYARERWPEEEGWYYHSAEKTMLLPDRTIKLHYDFLVKRQDRHYVHEK